MKTYTADDFGPNGAEIAALIEKIRVVTPAQCAALVDAWEATGGAAWNSAWDAAWDAARDNAWDAAWDALRDAASDAGWKAAWDVAGDAMMALLVRDLITAEQFSTLYGTWASVMEKGN